MSAATARSLTRPAARPSARSAAYLRLVATRRSSAARAPFIAVVVGILAVGLLLLLLLNTVLAQDAFRLHSLQVQGRQLADQEQALQREVERLQSPASLANRAGALGMVPGGPPAFLRLADGKVIGAAVPGQAAPPPVVPSKPAPAAKPATAKKAQPAAPAEGTWVVVPGTPR
ncbi:MAG: hypothetical protein JJD92_15345 [Frankiaceae bacterium]|nr:hypothetical protein [Frankiaceae bacterium]